MLFDPSTLPNSPWRHLFVSCSISASHELDEKVVFSVVLVLIFVWCFVDCGCRLVPSPDNLNASVCWLKQQRSLMAVHQFPRLVSPAAVPVAR